jgi:hypothetical protein
MAQQSEYEANGVLSGSSHSHEKVGLPTQGQDMDSAGRGFPQVDVIQASGRRDQPAQPRGRAENLTVNAVPQAHPQDVDRGDFAD